MNSATLVAFADELAKIAATKPENFKALAAMKKAVRKMKFRTERLPVKKAEMVKYTKVKTSGELARKINAGFGLPLTGKKHVRRYENGPAAAQSADASQYPVAGMATPNISASNTMSPAYGPGGV